MGSPWCKVPFHLSSFFAKVHQKLRFYRLPQSCQQFHSSMSGYQQGGGHYNDGYGHQEHGDSFYQDEHGQAYYDHDYGDGYYDRSYVSNS